MGIDEELRQGCLEVLSAHTYHSLSQRHPLRTRSDWIACIFDICACDDLAGGSEEGGADVEIGVGA